MANPVVTSASAAESRALWEWYRPITRRPAAAESLTPVVQMSTSLELLALVLRQQLSQDALLLWRHERRRGCLRLLAATPLAPWQGEISIPLSEPLVDLCENRLEAVAHVHCLASADPLERLLSDLHLPSGLTSVITSEGDCLLMTCGYRERWQLVAPQTPAVVALSSYLRLGLAVAQGGNCETAWWQLPSHLGHIWRQPWRPSVMRSVYDLGEWLIEVAEACRPLGGDDGPQVIEQIACLARRGNDLMTRLENVYLDGRSTVTTEELLSEALLLVRAAYLLRTSTWPGCLAAMNSLPEPAEANPAALRQSLIDWLITRISEEQTSTTTA